MVTSFRVYALGIQMTIVLSGAALVQFGAIEFVNAPVTGETFATIRTGIVDAPSVQMTVVPLQTALLLTFVYIYRNKQINKQKLRTKYTINKTKAKCIKLVVSFYSSVAFR